MGSASFRSSCDSCHGIACAATAVRVPVVESELAAAGAVRQFILILIFAFAVHWQAVQ
jgi:hypothetical protein